MSDLVARTKALIELGSSTPFDASTLRKALHSDLVVTVGDRDIGRDAFVALQETRAKSMTGATIGYLAIAQSGNSGALEHYGAGRVSPAPASPQPPSSQAGRSGAPSR
jgi:hypothetical protein